MSLYVLPSHYCHSLTIVQSAFWHTIIPQHYAIDFSETQYSMCRFRSAISFDRCAHKCRLRVVIRSCPRMEKRFLKKRARGLGERMTTVAKSRECAKTLRSQHALREVQPSHEQAQVGTQTSQ